MIATLSSSFSAIELNWSASSVSSDEPAWTSAGSMRSVKSPSAIERDASVRRRSGVVKRWATAAATIIASPSATTPTAARRLVTFAIVVWRNVYGFDEADPDRCSVDAAGRVVDRDRRLERLLASRSAAEP